MYMYVCAVLPCVGAWSMKVLLWQLFSSSSLFLWKDGIFSNMPYTEPYNRFHTHHKRITHNVLMWMPIFRMKSVNRRKSQVSLKRLLQRHKHWIWHYNIPISPHFMHGPIIWHYNIPHTYYGTIIFHKRITQHFNACTQMPIFRVKSVNQRKSQVSLNRLLQRHKHWIWHYISVLRACAYCTVGFPPHPLPLLIMYIMHNYTQHKREHGRMYIQA